jgi:hypothetical protein
MAHHPNDVSLRLQMGYEAEQTRMNFLERRACELRRIHLPRTRMNKAAMHLAPTCTSLVAVLCNKNHSFG